MESKIIIVTGISGSGSRNFCRRYAKDNKVKLYHTGDMVYELAQSYPEGPPVPKENLLNLQPDILNGLRNKAFDVILGNLEQDRKEYDKILIDTHAEFFWNHVYTNAYDSKYLNEILADIFVTIIDKPSAIKERQMKTAHGRVQDHDYRDLLLWQNIEVNVTKDWASRSGKPMYIFSNKQNPDVMDSLIENYFLIYSSFPMTDAGSDANRRIDNFKTRLRNLRKEIDGKETPIIDPADIDVETDAGLSERIRDTIGAQTVHRDLNRDITQSTHIVAYYPDARALSKGVSDECTRGRQTGKFVYVICPREKMSPFMDIAHKVFKDEEEFFAFFREHMKEALEYFKRSNFKK